MLKKYLVYKLGKVQGETLYIKILLKIEQIYIVSAIIFKSLEYYEPSIINRLFKENLNCH